MIILGDRINLPYMVIHYMNGYFQSPKSYLPYGAIMTGTFKAFNVPIIDDDKIIKLRSIDIDLQSLNYEVYGYTFNDEVRGHMANGHDKENDNEEEGQPITYTSIYNLSVLSSLGSICNPIF